MSKPSVLFTSHPLFIPVIKQLKDDIEVQVIDTGFAQSLSNLDIGNTNITSLIDETLREAATYESAKIIAASFSVGGYKDKISEGGVKFIRERLPVFLYARALDMSTLILTLDKAKPKMIVLHNDVDCGARTMALWAKTRGIKCLHVPHAVYQDVGRGTVGTDIHDTVTSSHLAASGAYQRKWYEERGMSPSNIKETGLPQFDKWASLRVDRTRAAKLFRLDPFLPVVTYMATWRQNTNLAGCNDLWVKAYVDFLEACKRLGNSIQLAVKIHPNAGQDNIKVHIDLANKMGVRCLITPHYLDLILQVSNLVFAPFGSNVLIDASFMPQCRLSTFEGHGYFGDNAVKKVPMTVDGIAEGITKILSSDPIDSTLFRTKYAGMADGKAHERVADFIWELLL